MPSSTMERLSILLFLYYFLCFYVLSKHRYLKNVKLLRNFVLFSLSNVKLWHDSNLVFFLFFFYCGRESTALWYWCFFFTFRLCKLHLRAWAICSHYVYIVLCKKQWSNFFLPLSCFRQEKLWMSLWRLTNFILKGRACDLRVWVTQVGSGS